MNKANKAASAKDEERPHRITRARAKVLGSVGGIPPYSRPSFKNEQKHVLRGSFTRTGSDENKTSVVVDPLDKRKQVLNDVTNICSNASTFQIDSNNSISSSWHAFCAPWIHIWKWHV
ncbi:hypothetical protein S245_027886 [Arachis hypogaea]